MCRPEELEGLPRIQTHTSKVMHDASGNVVASEGLKASAPWVVFASAKYQGRFFFLNTDTNQSAWSLPPKVVFGIPQVFEKAKWNTPALPPVKDSAAAVSTAPCPFFLSGGKGEPSSQLTDSSSDDGSNSSPSHSDSRSSSIDWNSVNGEASELQESMEEVEEAAPCSSAEQPVYRVMDGCGYGSYGVVLKVEHLKSRKQFAMKVISKKTSRTNSNDSCRKHQIQLKNELKFMTEVSPSPFLQRCSDTFESPSSVFFVMDLISGGDLFYHLCQRVSSGGMFSEQEAKVMLAELYLGVAHLHKHGIVHRDIKIENIMLDAQGHIKLVDYGLAVEIEAEVQPMAAMGSLIYMAPELVRDRTGGRHTDWWAYGVLAHELLTGNTPWSSLTNAKVIKREIQSGILEELPGVSKAANDFVMSLMSRDVLRRLGTGSDDEIMKSSFFSSIDWVKTAHKESDSAFVPNVGAIHVRKEDQKIALKTYYDLMENRSVNVSTWSLGLEDSSKYVAL